MEKYQFGEYLKRQLIIQKNIVWNIYFCENGIIFASFDAKPFAVEEVLLPFIEKYEFDDIHMNIYTKDERKFLITTTDAKEILKVLKDKKWIE